MRCYFHLASADEELLDEEGIEVRDLEDAKIQAQTAIDELRQEIGDEVMDWRGWRLRIVCSKGSLLYSIALYKTLH